MSDQVSTYTSEKPIHMDMVGGEGRKLRILTPLLPSNTKRENKVSLPTPPAVYSVTMDQAQISMKCFGE